MKKFPAMMNHTNWVYVWNLGKHAWNQELGKIECISYNQMVSIYPGVFQIYTSSCRWVHLRYPCIPVCIYIERVTQYMPYHDEANLVTVTKTNIIDKMSCCCGMLRTAAVGIWHQVFRRACAAGLGCYWGLVRISADVSATQEVSRRPAQRS